MHWLIEMFPDLHLVCEPPQYEEQPRVPRLGGALLPSSNPKKLEVTAGRGGKKIYPVILKI